MDEDIISFSKEEMISIKQAFLDGLNAEPSPFMKSIIHSDWPERSKREDSVKGQKIIQTLDECIKIVENIEMRCSEHCGDTVREVQ